MMKTTIIKNIGCGLLLLGTTACADYLDKESFDIITPEQVWQDPKLINGVMVNLYDGLNLEDFNYWYRDAWRLQNASSMSDEAQGSFQKDPLFDNGNATYTYEDALFEQKFSDRYKNISEVRRAGKEGRSRWSSLHSKIYPSGSVRNESSATTLSTNYRKQRPYRILKRNCC